MIAKRTAVYRIPVILAAIVSVAAVLVTQSKTPQHRPSDVANTTSIATVELAADSMEATLVKERIKVRLFREDALDGIAPVGIEILVDEISVLHQELREEHFGNRYPGVAIAHLGESGRLPEVIFATYPGGVRCCWAVSVFTTASNGGKWSRIDLEEVPALFDYSGSADFLRDIIRDIDGDGYLEIVDYHSFYGLFCDDGEVSSPLRIRRVSSGQLVDVTRDPKYLPAHRAQFARLLHFAKGKYVPNRDLPGLVASGRLVGEGELAWKLMRERYQEVGSAIGVNEPCWPAEELHKESFPKALDMLLIQNGYGRYQTR